MAEVAIAIGAVLARKWCPICALFGSAFIVSELWIWWKKRKDD
jgi:hypothetical protein